MSEWSLLSNHGLILLTVADRPQITTREIAVDLGVTERSVQRIVSELEASSYISKYKMGRQNYYEVNRQIPLRHPVKKDKTVGNLLVELTA